MYAFEPSPSHFGGEGSNEAFSAQYSRSNLQPIYQKRLNRHTEEHTTFDFGSKDYSREELVAELGSAFLCAEAQIDNSVIDTNTAYVQSWLKVLQADNKLIIHASARASKAAEYILKKEEGSERLCT